MESHAETNLDWHSAKALLDWQVEMGVVDAVMDAPINRYELVARAAKPATPPGPPHKRPPGPPPAEPVIDHVAIAKQMAEGSTDIDGLKSALKLFDGCALKEGARNMVFADGNPAARVMVIGDPPSADEDRAGKPMVNGVGQMFDRMFAAIQMGRETPLSKDALYVTSVMPWRPPQDRSPSAAELKMMIPFLERHIQLIAPEIIILMGNIPCSAILEKGPVTRLRGQWTEAFGKPVLPMTHPAYLLKNPAAKREAWADLLSLQAKLRDTP